MKKNLFGVLLIGLLFTGVSYAQDADQGSGEEHSHHSPSQAAIDACSGKSEGDACDYTNSKGEDKSGACANSRDGQTMYCKRSKSS